jgi:hypothetical protein
MLVACFSLPDPHLENEEQKANKHLQKKRKNGK